MGENDKDNQTYNYSLILKRQKRLLLASILMLVVTVGLIGVFLHAELVEHAEEDITSENDYSAHLVYRSLKSAIIMHGDLTVRLSKDKALEELTKKLLLDYENGVDLIHSDSLIQTRDFYKEKNILNNEGYFIIAPDYFSIASSRNTNIGTKNLIANHYPELLVKAFRGMPAMVPPIESDVPLMDMQGNLVYRSETMFYLSPIFSDGVVIAVLAIRLPTTYIFSRVFDSGINQQGIEKEVNLFSASGVLTDESYGLIFSHEGIRPHPPQIADEIRNYKGQDLIKWNQFNYEDNHNQQVGGVWLWDPEMGIGVVSEYSLSTMNKSIDFISNTFGISLAVLIAGLTGFMFSYSQQARKIDKALHLNHQSLEAYAKDQTKEIKTAYLVLEESKNNLEQLINSGPDAMLGVDSKGRVLLANAQAAKLFGYEEESMIGLPLGELMPDAYRGQHGGHIKKFFENFTEEVMSTSNIFAKTKQGVEFPADVKIVSIMFYGQRVAVANIRDMTEKIKLENRLRENEELYRMIFLSSPLALCRFDRAGRVRVANEMFEKITRFGNFELEATNIQDIFASNQEHMAIINDALSGCAGIYCGEFSPKDSDDKLYINAIYNTVINEHNESAGVVVAIWDLTTQKKAEIERDNLSRELSKAQKLESIGVLAGGIAHEFNNMLSPIIGYSEMAKEDLQGSDFGEVIEYLDSVITSAKIASDVVRQLLTFSREDTGQKTVINVVSVVKETVKLLTPTISSDIDISFGNLDSEVFVNVDPVLFHQSFINLLINAKDAISVKGKITISVNKLRVEGEWCASCHKEVRGEYVVICVEDTGCGITAEQINNIFDPFYSTKDVKRGTGLGLSITHGVMHNSEGHVLIESTPGIGTQMALLFPVERDVAHQLGKAAAPDDMAETQLEGSAKVLIVDDDQDITNYMGILLQNYGYSVDVYNSGESAWQTLSEQDSNYELVITDVVMPGMSGLDLIDNIRSIDKEIPVIIMTGYNADVDESNFGDYEANAFMAKPIANWRLLYAIKELLIHNK